jgi:hypothetical protein
MVLTVFDECVVGLDTARDAPPDLLARIRRGLKAVLEPLPEPGVTIIELNKRVRALQLRLEKARKAGFADQGDD